MKIYGLIGNPLTHSFSQKYFTEKFRKENISDSVYRNFEIQDHGNEIALLKKETDLCGLNITIPYKSTIIQYLDEISKECKEINACNCIKISDGKWIGFNTDITGFERSFIPHLQHHHKKALILGTGGSSKAVAYVLKKEGFEFLFVTSKKEISAGAIHYDNISQTIMQEFTIVINTTPVGMYPHVNAYPKLPYEFISDRHYFFDLIYNPSKTAFLSKGEAKGAIIKNGDQMLIIQAEESWKIWSQNINQ
jgi:shikimate dehydrogenase